MSEVRKSNLLDDKVAFPVLDADDFEKAAEFGTRCAFTAGETLFSAGDRPFDCFVILSGDVCIFDVSNDDRVCVVQYGTGHFTGDIDLFTGRRAVVSGEAITPVEALRITPERLRRLFVRRPDLGERIWKAMQRRRELLLETSFQGLRVYGRRDDKETWAAVELLFRNGVPHQWMDLADPHNIARLREICSQEMRYPVVTYGRRILFQAPTLLELAEHIGLRRRASAETYDVVILGAGPSGLGAAVYAASEGLSTLVLDAMGPGGQAGSSSKIENYAGFPNGLAGRELAQLSYLQALKFGAEFVAPSHVTCLAKKRDGLYEIGTSEGDPIRAKTVIVSTGVSYRLLEVAGLDTLRGPGVYYNATRIEANLCHSHDVHVVGAGNSAGQAAMFLSQYARMVTLVVRGGDLRKSMSAYLSDRVVVNERIKISYHTQVTAIEGSDRLEAVHLRNEQGHTRREETCGLFIFIGARPRTDFLPPEIARDAAGFVLTGTAVASLPAWTEERTPCSLETTWPGVFAAGDCRGGTTKRVAFAIGDGALAVTCVHDYLGTYN
jgi:thioredoxin reductase (NADPH)